MTRFSARAFGFVILVTVIAAGCAPQFNLSNDASNGDLVAVQRDLANKVDPNTKVAGESVLSYAAANGRLSVVQTLLRAGADVNAKDDNDSSTALMCAAGGGHNDVIKVLAAAGANLEARDNGGSTALYLAAIQDKPDTVQALIDAGADVNESTIPDGPTILSVFADNPKYTAVTQVLIRNGAHS